MPLDPQMRAYLDQMAALNSTPMHNFPPEMVRQGMLLELANASEPEPVAHIENQVIAGPQGEIPIRIYTPTGDGPFPLLVFFHGGGWVIGNLDTHDNVCRNLTNAAGCIVVSVDYHLAPEYKFPAAPEDCFAATQWVVANASQLNGDTSRIAVGGDSAGGNLAAVVALMARDQGGPALVFQLLIYPVTDATGSSPSMIENAEGYGLTREDMIWFTNHYLNNEDEQRNPLASPLLAPDLSGLPPALIISAEYDPLRDEAELYAQRLQDAGVPVKTTRYSGAIHGFASRPFDLGKKALGECSSALRVIFKMA
jgi:acetyl esterase